VRYRVFWYLYQFFLLMCSLVVKLDSDTLSSRPVQSSLESIYEMELSQLLQVVFSISLWLSDWRNAAWELFYILVSSVSYCGLECYLPLPGGINCLVAYPPVCEVFCMFGACLHLHVCISDLGVSVPATYRGRVDLWYKFCCSALYLLQVILIFFVYWIPYRISIL